MIIVPSLLNNDEVQRIRGYLKDAQWEDGKDTAHGLAKAVKNNWQLTSGPACALVQRAIQTALENNTKVKRHAMPVRILSVFLNKHGEGCAYGKHVDRAMRVLMPSGGQVRCDLSCSIFLSEKSEYDGGELVVYDGDSSTKLKLNAGDAVIYPAYFIHEVKKVTRGERLAACTWMQSAIRDRDQRQLVSDVQGLINQAATNNYESNMQTTLSKVHMNLQRMWAEV